MFEWFGFDEFKPSSDRVFTHDDVLINKIIDDAREFLSGWSDQQIIGAAKLIFEESDLYITMAVGAAEEIRAMIVEAGEDLVSTSMNEEFYDDAGINFKIAGKKVYWPELECVNEALLLDMLGEHTVHSFIASKEICSLLRLKVSDDLKPYTSSELLACLALESIDSYATILKYPLCDEWFVPDNKLTFSNANPSQQLEGTQKAMTYALRAAQYLLSAKEAHHSDLKALKKKNVDQSVQRREIAKKGGQAKAKKYEPLKKFIFDYYHKSEKVGVPSIAQEVIKPLLAHCEKIGCSRILTPQNTGKTIERWLYQHRQDCPTCKQLGKYSA